MQYKIRSIGNEPKTFNGTYGQMTSYRVKLTDYDEIVEVVQKSTTKAPSVGDVLGGIIEHGQYGPKFKKDFSPRPSTGGGAKSDPRAFYVSYAKDLVVGLIASGTLPSTPKFANEYDLALAYINEGATRLEQNKGSNDAEELKQDIEPVEEMPEGLDEDGSFDE